MMSPGKIDMNGFMFHLSAGIIFQLPFLSQGMAEQTKGHGTAVSVLDQMTKLQKTTALGTPAKWSTKPTFGSTALGSMAGESGTGTATLPFGFAANCFISLSGRTDGKGVLDDPPVLMQGQASKALQQPHFASGFAAQGSFAAET